MKKYNLSGAVIILFLFLFCTAESLAETESNEVFKMHIGSRHYTTEKLKFNEDNFGIGYQRGDYEVGFFENSHYRTSVYLVKNWRINDSAFWFAGAVTGYEKIGPIAPIFGITYTWHYFQLTAFPGLAKGGTEAFVPVIAFSLSYKHPISK